MNCFGTETLYGNSFPTLNRIVTTSINKLQGLSIPIVARYLSMSPQSIADEFDYR